MDDGDAVSDDHETAKLNFSIKVLGSQLCVEVIVSERLSVMHGTAAGTEVLVQWKLDGREDGTY